MARTLTHQAGTIRIEYPAGQQKLHRRGVIACAKVELAIKLMCLFDLFHIRFDAEAGTFRNGNDAIANLKRFTREPLTVLPDPMSIDSCDSSSCRGCNMSKHGEGDIEMVVGVGAPCQSPVPAEL